MTTTLAEWVSGHRQITKIKPSDANGAKIVPKAAHFGYGRSGFEDYLENVG